MKYLFIFLFCIMAPHLHATFNLDVKQVTQDTSSQKPPNTSVNGQGTFTPPKGRLNLMSEMSKSEQKATGILRLNDSQRMALSTWVELWCQANQTRVERIEEQPSPNTVTAILGDGHYVKMGDHTVWNVSPNGWIFTYYWKAGETVNVSKGPDALFPYTLSNDNYPITVNAKKAASHITQSFRESYTITDITGAGKILTLSNGSTWEIPASVRYMVAGWSTGNTIFVTKVHKASGEHFEIFNGVTARSIYVKMLSRGKSTKNKTLRKRQPQNIIPEINTEDDNASEDTPQTDSSDDTHRSEGS